MVCLLALAIASLWYVTLAHQLRNSKSLLKLDHFKEALRFLQLIFRGLATTLVLLIL